MSLPELTELVTLKSPGAFRAAALDAEDRAWRLFTLRFQGEADALLGRRYHALIRSLSKAQGGAFVELENKVAGFLPIRGDALVKEGERICVEIVAEARTDKLARVRLSEQGPGDFDAFSAWKASLPVTAPLPECEDRERLTDAFQDAALDSVTLPGGGRLHLEQTRALVALDIDTAGREMRGSAGARALSVNRDAAFEAARQIALRNLGGAIVVDCLAPMNRAAGEKVRSAFEQVFRAVSRRCIDVLAPSRFGLMEAAIAWAERPVNDLAGTVESDLLRSLDEASREAAHQPAKLFDVCLSPAAFQVYQDHRTVLDADLKSMFGGRVQVSKGAEEVSKVVRK